MVYALVITIAAGLLLLALLAAAYLLARRAADGTLEWPALGGWRWQPSVLGLTVALVLGGVLLSRLFPAFLFLPVVLPFFWWRRQRPSSSGDDAVEGRWRPLDDR